MAEPRSSRGRLTGMSCRAAVVVTLCLVSACGGGSEVLRTGPPLAGSSSAPATSGLPAPYAGTSPQPTRTAKVPPAGPTAGSGYATAGTASSGPGRLSSPQPAGSSKPATSPQPAPSASAATVTVTDGDSGKTVHLRPGQRLRVRLSQGTWDPPVSSDSNVMTRRSSSGGYPTDQPVDATFSAEANGRATVSAQSDAACFHSSPRCLMPTRQWSVQVLVP